MEKLKELYLIVSKYPRTCDLTRDEKEVVFEFFRQYNKQTKQIRSASICGRYHIVHLAKKYLTAHGQL